MAVEVDNIQIPIDCLHDYFELTPEGKISFQAIINNKEDYSLLVNQGGLMELDIDLRCAFQKTHLYFPARTKACKHINAMNLLHIIKRFYSGKPKSKECSNCNQPINNLETDVRIDVRMKEILQKLSKDINSVHYNLRNATYYIITDSSQRERSALLFKIVDENNEKHKTDSKHGTKLLKALTEDKDNTTISLMCNLSGKRMNYACRFHECDHVECFDLEELLQTFQADSIWECPLCPANMGNPKKVESEGKINIVIGSKTKIDIEIDQNITAECLRLDKSVREVVFNTSRNKLLPIFEDRDLWYDTLQGDSENTKIVMQDYYKRELQSLIGNYQATTDYSESVKKIIEEAKVQDKKTIEIDLLDPIMKVRMNIPAKLNNCEHVDCCEINTYISNYAKKIVPLCPICPKNKILPSDSDPSDTVVIDVFAMKALQCLSRSNTVLYLVNHDVFIPKTTKELKCFPSTVKKIINKNPPITRDSLRYKNKESGFPFKLRSLICNDDCMKDPITMPDCKHHACMDLSEYFRKRPETCCSPGCGIKIDELELTRDLVMTEVLQQVSITNYRFYEGEYILSTKKILPKQMDGKSVILNGGNEMIISLETSKRAPIKITDKSGPPSSQQNAFPQAQSMKTNSSQMTEIDFRSTNSDGNSKKQIDIPSTAQFNAMEESRRISTKSYASSQNPNAKK
jgi:hypothetical protein